MKRRRNVNEKSVSAAHGYAEGLVATRKWSHERIIYESIALSIAATDQSYDPGWLSDWHSIIGPYLEKEGVKCDLRTFTGLVAIRLMELSPMEDNKL